MGLGVTLHLMAGLGALVLGGATLLREPGRRRNHRFALLCGALALWNLGLVGHRLSGPPPLESWRLAFLLGSCLAAPQALAFALGLTGAQPSRARRLLVPAFSLACLLWAAAASGALSESGWALASILILGSILGSALAVVGRSAFTRPAGPERAAMRIVLGAGLLAAAGGLSDFVPRDPATLPKLGPPTLLIFLVVLCSVMVRYRFLDVHAFLARAVALVAGSALAALLLQLAFQRGGGRYAVIFVATLVVVAVAAGVVRAMSSRAGDPLGASDPVARALLRISRELPLATSADDVWSMVEGGRRGLPGRPRIEIVLRRASDGAFELAHGNGEAPPTGSDDTTATTLLANLLSVERLPVTRRYLEHEEIDARGDRRRQLGRLVAHFAARDMHLAAPLLDGDRLVGWIALGGDLAQRHLRAEVGAAAMAVGQQARASLARVEAVEQAKRREALAAVGELAAGLAHEVRNPVAAIRGAVQAMGPQATAEQEREMREVIEEESDRLDRVVGEFLDYARPAPPRRDSVDAAELARRGIRRLELAGRHLSVQIDAEAARAVIGDPDQIMRAFDNLLRNAWEAAGEAGHLRIDIREEGDDRVSIRFEDDGPGISAETMPRLFQPFHTTKPGGTGLGLALIHRIVDAHGGEVRVEGRPGLGAAFTLVLPAAASRGSED